MNSDLLLIIYCFAPNNVSNNCVHTIQIFQMQHALKQLFLKHAHLTPHELSYIEERLSPISWSKGDRILEESTDAGEVYFVVSGLLRFFTTTESTERTFLFLDAPITLICGEEVIDDQTIQTLEKCMAFKLSRSAQNEIAVNVPGWTTIWHRMTIEVEDRKKRIQKSVDLISAEEWYMRMLTNCDPILARIPLKFLASYLGTSPALLGQLRKKLMSEMTLSRYITARV